MIRGKDRYRLPGLRCTIDGRTRPVVDLSVGGFFVESTELPALGRVVTALLALGDGIALEISGKVAWINDAVLPRVPDLPSGFGVKIQRISFGDRLKIVRVLSKAGSPAKRPSHSARRICPVLERA